MIKISDLTTDELIKELRSRELDGNDLFERMRDFLFVSEVNIRELCELEGVKLASDVNDEDLMRDTNLFRLAVTLAYSPHIPDWIEIRMAMREELRSEYNQHTAFL